eukprot:5470604-Amphidinium_carterae.1
MTHLRLRIRRRSGVSAAHSTVVLGKCAHAVSGSWKARCNLQRVGIWGAIRNTRRVFRPFTTFLDD